jgi:hypothetical protein
MFYNYIEVIFNSLENYPDSKNIKSIIRENENLLKTLKLYNKNNYIDSNLYQNGGIKITDESKETVSVISNLIKDIKTKANSTQEIKKHFDVVYKIAELLLKYANIINSMLINGDENIVKLQEQIRDIMQIIHSYN